MTNLFKSLLPALALLLAACAPTPQSSETAPTQKQLFEDGNYAMFIHFGLYSSLEGEWEGKTYRGNAEWIMHPLQAGIPCEEYMALAKDFNPSQFDADEIVALAKDAGMKYIVITSKHHEGFAMFKSDVCDFNIADATPCGRDLVGELAEACHREGLGIGFYYSQFQDWTAPGGDGGPKTDASGRPVDFEEYFRTKCVPQVEEITTRYGQIELIWFDTPGLMDISYSEELVELVHKNQPGCLVSSRVGNGLGDYETLGDMECPVANVEGMWEGIDVTQVGWGYNREDKEWKSPEYILRNLMTTIARGGTFMMNIGPKADGTVAEPAARALRKAGEWVRAHEEVVRAVDPSPWGHPLPWGDAVAKGDRLYLLVYDWPRDGRLVVPGLTSEPRSAKLCGGGRLKYSKEGDALVLNVPATAPESIISVIELSLGAGVEVDRTHAAIDGYSTELSAYFASVEGAEKFKDGWMPRYGEWNAKWAVRNFTPEGSAAWTVDIPHEGYYEFDVELKGEGLVDFALTTDEGEVLTNCQPAYDIYTWQRAGWIHFAAPGRHTVTLSGCTAPAAHMATLRITPVQL